MVGVFEDIGKVGRNYGIGNSLISQRPQAINKDVLNQIEVLLAFQTNGPQERKAIARWTAENTNAGVAMMQELPKLKVGDALVWSPQWLRIAEQVHISQRQTYDASSTPTARAKAIKPKTLAKADLEQLGTQIAATLEKAKADDPRELRKQIQALERELAGSKVKGQISNSQVPTPKVVERPVQKDAQIARIEKMVERFGKTLDGAMKQHAAICEPLQQLVSAVHAVQRQDSAAPTRAPYAPERTTSAPRPPRPAAAPRTVAESNGSLPPAKQKILNGLAFLHGIAVAPADKTQLALMVGVSPTSGGYFNNLGSLRSDGLIEYPSGGTVALTAAGEQHASTNGVPSTTDELHDAIRAKLPPAKWKILEQVIARISQGADEGRARRADRCVADVRRVFQQSRFAAQSRTDRLSAAWRCCGAAGAVSGEVTVSSATLGTDASPCAIRSRT